MKASLKERVYVLPIEHLDEMAYSKAHLALREFLEGRIGVYSFREEWQKIPVVTRPRITVNGDEPDWSQLKLAVRNVAIFRDRNARVLIQLTESFISINALVSADEETPASLEILDDLYKRFLAFFNGQDSNLVKPLSLISEEYYVFDKEHLDPYVIERDSRPYPHFLDIQKVMRPGVIPKLQMEMNPPLKQASRYLAKKDGIDFHVFVDIEIGIPGGNPENGWQFALDVKIDSLTAPTAQNAFGLEKASALESVMKDSLGQLFSDDVVTTLGVDA